MRQSLLVIRILLSGCALAGLEGPERRAKAQEQQESNPRLERNRDGLGP